MKRIEERPLLVHLISLGCAKNFVDTEVAAGALLRAGIGMTPDEEEADVMIVNTCAFIESARAESAAAVRGAVAWKLRDAENRRVLVSGCITEWKGTKSFRAAYPEVDLWCRIDSIADMANHVFSLFGGKKVPQPAGAPTYLYTDKTDRVLLTPGHFAYMKIAEGCGNRCAYCAIPSIRGDLRSRTEKSVVKEAENLLASGVRELIVIAQDIGAFGMDRGEKDGLAKLVEKLDALPGDFLLRLMYLHPARVTDRLCKALASAKHLARCIEMPLQHISDPVLKSMGRLIGEDETRKAVEDIRKKAGCAIRTTFLTGFPGETEADFRTLEEFVRESEFERMGVFAFSPEQGTRAADMPDQVPAATAERRARKLMSIQKEISLAANRSLVGGLVKVIFDTPAKRGRAEGRTIFDAPEIDNRVIITKVPAGIKPGDFATVQVVSADAYGIKTIFSAKEDFV